MIPPSTDYTPFNHQGWQGFHLNSASDWIGGTDLVGHALSHPHQTIHERTGAGIWLVEGPSGPAYVKHFKTLKNNFQGKPPKLIHKLKWRYQPSRAIHTLNITQQMTDADILVPRTLLAARITQGLNASDILITQPIEGQPLATVLATASLQDKHRLLAVAGAEIAKLHNAGFTHGDCLTVNTFLTDDQQRIVFLDNDRTQKSTRAQYRNLNQFLYRVLLHHGHEPALAFMHAYDHTRNFTNPSTRLRQWRKILNHASKKTQRQFLPRLLQYNPPKPRSHTTGGQP